MPDKRFTDYDSAMAWADEELAQPMDQYETAYTTMRMAREMPEEHPERGRFEQAAQQSFLGYMREEEGKAREDSMLSWLEEVTDPRETVSPQWYRLGGWSGLSPQAIQTMRRERLDDIASVAKQAALGFRDREDSYQQIADNWDKEDGPAGPAEMYAEPYGKVFDFYRSKRDLWYQAKVFAETGQISERRGRPEVNLSQMSQEDRDLFDNFVAEQTTPEKRGLWAKITEAQRREWPKIAQAAGAYMGAVEHGALSLIRPEFAGDRPSPMVEYAEQAKTRGVKEAVDPLITMAERESMGMASRGLVGAASMMPRMLTGMATHAVGGPGAAVAFWTVQIAPDRFAELRERGISDSVAAPLAMATALPEAMVEMLQVRALTPNLSRALRQSVKASLGRFVLGKLKTAGKVFTQEWLEELVQEGISVASAQTGTWMDKNAPAINYSEELSRVTANMEQVTMSLPWLMLPGAAIEIAAEAGAKAKPAITPPAEAAGVMTDWVKTQERITKRMNRDARRAYVASGMVSQPLEVTPSAELEAQLTEAREYGDIQSERTSFGELHRRLDQQAQQAFDAGDAETHAQIQEHIDRLRSTPEPQIEEVSIPETPVVATAVETERAANEASEAGDVELETALREPVPEVTAEFPDVTTEAGETVAPGELSEYENELMTLMGTTEVSQQQRAFLEDIVEKRPSRRIGEYARVVLAMRYGVEKGVAAETGNIYLKMPIERVRTDAQNGVKLAQQALQVKEDIEAALTVEDDATVVEGAAEEAMREADARPEVAWMHAGVPVPKARTPAGVTPIEGDFRAPRPDVEARFEAAKGYQREGLFERIRRYGTAIRGKLRPQEFIPVTPEFAAYNEVFRLQGEIRQRVTDESIRTVGAITDALSDAEYEGFGRYLYMKNMQEALTRNEPLRYGLTRAEVDPYVEKLEAAMQKRPQIAKAVATRQAIVKELARELHRHKLLPEGVDRDWYYHQQVLAYQQGTALATSLGLRKRKRPFQQARVKGESLSQEFDPNSDYIEAELKWMVDAKIEIEKAKVWEQLDALSGKMYQRIRGQAREQGRDWHELIPDGWEDIQPEPGNVFYPAVTLPQKLIEQIQVGALEDADIDPSLLRRVIAMGGPRKPIVVPSEVAAQVGSMTKAKPSDLLRALSSSAMSSWKIWALLNPKRALPYMIRNMTGDVDAVIAGAPGVLKHLPWAWKQMRDYYRGNLALSEDARNMRDLGVIGASFTAKEIPDAKQSIALRRFYRSRTGLLAWTGKNFTDYFRAARHVNEFRESLLRAGAYRYYLDQLNAGTLRDYGGAKAGVVDALAAEMGNEVAAAHLSRNLLGDYGNLSVMGNWLRRHLVPFWSWMEINTVRWPRLVINAARVGKGKPITTAAALSAVAMSRLGAMYGAFWAWNNLVRRDEEEDLGPFDRANPHVNLGRTPDGSVRVFRNVGALGDFLEWFGINDFLSIYPQWQSGQVSGEDFLKHIAKAPLQKAFQGLRPDMKGAFELVAGQSYFPDVTEPRTVPRGAIATGVFGLQDEYRMIEGLLGREGARARPYYWQRYLFGVSDPRRNALFEIYDLREKFLKTEGEERPAFRGGPTGFTNMRYAAMAEDYDAFLEGRNAYLDAGKTAENFAKSLDNLDPIAARLRDELEYKFEHNYLNSFQKRKLNVARRYAQELKIRLWHWWFKASQEEGKQ